MTRVAPTLLSEQASLTTDGGSIRDFIALLKPRVMSLVVFSGFAGLAVAPGHIHPLIGAVAVLCIAVGAGASGAINMWFDRDIDAVMNRTCGRPIPRGAVEPDAALSFGGVLAVFSVMLMGLAVNWTAAALLAFTIFFYVVDLHDVAEAPHAAEHRDRRRRRRVPADDRLGGGDRRHQPRLDLAVPADLHVDAAAFLGAVAVPRGRLRQGRRADDAGGGGPALDQDPDAALHAAAGADRAGAGAGSASPA